MFRIHQQDCRLLSVNPRAELHGEDTKLACDLKFKTMLPNDALEMFDDRLKTTLFGARPLDEQDLADQGMSSDYLPALRFPSMGPIKWEYESDGYTAHISRGITGYEDIKLNKVAIDKFVFECLEGGSVEMQFRVVAHPNTEAVGSLCELIQSDVDLSMIPPSASESIQQDIEDDFVEDDEYAEDLEGDEAA
jgi:hypothetical protein